MRVLNILILSFLLFFCFYSHVSARDISITANKTSLFGDEELIVIASTSGFLAEEQIYVKGAFFQENTTNYFGYTKNNNEWIKNSASSNSQKSVKVGEWDSSLVLKNDPQDTGYKGDGKYKVKLGFYYITSGGNISSVNWSSNTLDIALSYPTSSPTPPPTATVAPTNTPTVIPSITITPSTYEAKAVGKTSPPRLTSQRSVLGTQQEVSISPLPTVSIFPESKKSIILPSPFLLIGLSIIITGCGILLFREWKKQKELEL